MVAVSIQNLSKTYPTPLAKLKQFFGRTVTPPVEALRDVSFDIKAGEIFGLIGRNGAGKTTLTKIIATLVQPTSGTIAVLGKDSVRNEQQVRAKVGLASAEERSFYWRLTVEQNLLFFARLYGISTKDAGERIAELLERFELTQNSKRRFGELSTGNKQRMAVARALLARPPVLLLDEPTRSLDPLAAASMRLLIRSLIDADEPATVLLTSHNLAEVEELCERVGVISKGQIRIVDTPANLRAGHEAQERVRVDVRNLTAAQIESALQENHLMNNAPVHHSSFEINDAKTHVAVTFTRQTDDAQLDELLRRLQLAGGRIVNVHTERATLLDVLESYEVENGSVK